mmetsp:Transcript_62738/g.181855  ORF Transcript_62738/g.181855 Transcript_62738/m.181855 type:complete len:220 (-) Transcript_62738:183-842(-)|eukprot:CAMPEP_0170284436 /NCGR_PEP_ID=MMETSP0116_2-20130129/42256_1 /TAXON_ID=400756 /ORGANISM="Durinskia baltica, Strain CSIRO CS-38" /LENGTH=219 /DNA_ID=CAMNT_0010535815 /DNA_START=47 /DNA_END=706 /DNA_ORIENTATION=-
MKLSSSVLVVGFALVANVNALVTPSTLIATQSSSSTQLLGWFDKNWSAGGSGKDRLDDEWQKQQEILARRRAPKSERDAYFRKVEETRKEASKKQSEMWAWQTKTYGKGEDPINEWKKRRQDGTISDLEGQYGDPKKIGGIPIPGASFGVGGEFGVGGKFDNGGRFDLRLPYADQGYVDEDADFMGKLFGKKNKATKENTKAPSKQPVKPPKKKSGWPW